MSTESTLWMGGIESWMNEEIIMKSFLDCGIKPSSIKMIKDKRLNLIRNYCFINFDNMIEANKALIQLNGKKLPNANINFKLNWANQNCEGNLNLYVGNLNPEIDDIELYNLFKERYPSVHHASIITDKGISKGYGFIHFSEKEDYDKCLKEMDGYIFHKNALKVKERKNKNEEKKLDEKINSSKNNINNINLNKKNNFHKNNKNLNYIDSKRKININNINLNNNNSYYYKVNNNYYNNEKDLYINQFNINNMASFYHKIGGEEEYFPTDNESTFSSQEKEDLLSSSNSNSISSNNQKRKFSDSIELLESDDQKALNKKIQESVNKMFEHYKYNNKNSKSK